MAKTLPSPPLLLNLEPKSLAEVLGNIERRHRDGPSEKGNRGAANWSSNSLQAVQERAVAFLPTVFLMEWAEPIFNAGHWNPELIRLAGGRRCWREGEDSVRVPWDNWRVRRSEVLVIAARWPRR